VIVRAIAARFPSGMLYSAREAVTAVELGSRLNPSNWATRDPPNSVLVLR
jgi:hypothetical protein